MPKVLYERDGRIGRITLNRPEVMYAIDDDLPVELAATVARADADPDIHVMVLSGNGRAFCAGPRRSAGNRPSANATRAPMTGPGTVRSIRSAKAVCD